ncbi:hypothetical protein [Micromonospora zhanjiangensis]|uniref:Uncharacterized protein n=1 Tax=Micromonospora zhanjiangensis TaxID=1522057 RepID=A0ABV8KR39_9ACTN
MNEFTSTMLCCVLPVAIIVIMFVAGVKKEQAEEAALRSVGPVEKRVGRSVVLHSNPYRISVDTPGGRQTWPLTADTAISVETAGSITAVRGRNLSAKAVGGALTGGAGLFVFGNAKTSEVDNRELYIVIESDTLAHVSKVDPKLGQEARQFAASVNLIARQMGSDSVSKEPKNEDQED